MRNLFQIEEITNYRELKPKKIQINEDEFYSHIDFYYNEYNFLDNHLESISFDNIQIDLNFKNKNVGGGSWIKIKSNKGYDIFYAKKIKVNEYFLYKLLIKKKKLLSKDSENTELKSQIIFLEVCINLELKPYFVKVKRNNRLEYYLPYQYEICNNIDVYVNCVINKVKGITFKTHKNQR